MNPSIFVLLCATAVYAATTTHHPHHTHATHATHEPNEFEGITFTYNGLTHDLIVRQQVNKMFNCYIAALTMDEKNTVHTDAGMRALEIRVLGQLSNAIPVDVSTVDQHNARACAHPHNNVTVHYFTIP